MRRVGITGATGMVGSETARALEGSGLEVSLLVRNPSELGSIPGEVRRFDFFDAATYADAFRGLDQILLVSPGGGRELIRFLDFLHGLNLEQVIFLSGVGAELHPEISLGRLERQLNERKIPHHCLRLNWFMQNFLSYFRSSIVLRKIALPAGDSKTSFIDVRDIADVVASLFLAPRLGAAPFHLTGGEALSYMEVAASFSQVLGEAVDYVPVSEEDARQKFLEEGWGERGASEMIRLFRAIRQGVSAEVSPSVEVLLGRPPRTFEAFIAEHRKYWE